MLIFHVSQGEPISREDLNSNAFPACISVIKTKPYVIEFLVVIL